MKKNKGYTLVEMLIVIAIMAIVSGMAFVTIGIIYQAKYNTAIETFHSQLDSVWIKTKSLSEANKDKKPLCLLIKENTDSSDDVKDGCYELILGFRDGTKFTEKEVISTLTEIIDIKFTATSNEQKINTLTVLPKTPGGASETLSDPMVVEFNKSDGAVRYGAGTYEFIYNERVVGNVYLDEMTGNHYTK